MENWAIRAFWLCWPDSTNVERQGYTPSENVVAESLDRQFRNCDQRIIITTFASNMHRIQSVISTAQRYGRKVAVTGRSMENMLKVAQELGYLKVKQGHHCGPEHH